MPGADAAPPSRAAALGAILSVGLFLAYCQVFIPRGSADLTALWLAAGFLADGRPGLVYPADATLFTMLPPPEWFTRQAAHGITGDVFPYLYPPIWAALTAPLTRAAGPEGLIAAASALNPVLLAGCVWLAARIARAPLVPFLPAGLALLAVTQPGVIAIGQNQPQILVAVLTLLAIERSEAGAPRAAGAALALAAAVKLFPALIALIWIVSGQRRAALAFAVAGAALGLVSVLIAGWPLHAGFLRAVHALSMTALATNITWGLDGLTAPTVFAEAARLIVSPVHDPASGGPPGWIVTPKPVAYVIAVIIALGAVQIAAGRALRRTPQPDARAAVWAAALTFTAFLGPVAWAYYFLAPVAFLPLLLRRPGPAAGSCALIAFAAATCAFLRYPRVSLPGTDLSLHLIGPLAALAMGAVFIRLARPERPA